MSDTVVPRHHMRDYILCPINMRNMVSPNLFELGDLVYAKHPTDDGYHQARIEMVINSGRHYLVSWVNLVDPSMIDLVVHRRHVMGYIPHPSRRCKRANPNLNGGQDESDKAAGPAGH
eukprot:8358518-Ditylum_brightwellii.AAC.1